MAKFKNEFFVALNNWQRGWLEDQDKRKALAEQLEDVVKEIDYKYRSITKVCYRKRYILNGELKSLLIADCIDEGITSWTTDLNYAITFKGKYRKDAFTAAIFEHYPASDEVVINLQALWACDDFKNELDNFRKNNQQDCDAIDNFRDIQNEGILRAPLRGSEICRLVWESSSFEEICDKGDIPESERQQLSKDLAAKGELIQEPRFLSHQGTKNAIKNTLTIYYHRLVARGIIK